MNESCHTHEWVVLHIWLSHVTHKEEWHVPWMQLDSFCIVFVSCVYMHVTSIVFIFVHVWHDSSICLIWLIHMCDMTRSYTCKAISYGWHDSFVRSTWLMYMFHIPLSYLCHDSSICVTWLIYVCDMTHPYVRHDLFIHVTWFFHMCDTIHLYVWYDSFTCVNWLCFIRTGGLWKRYVK